MGKKDRTVSAKTAGPKSHAKAKMNGRVNGEVNGRGQAAEGKAAAKKQSAPKPLPKRAKPGVADIMLLPEGYRPSENEPFMNDPHKTYFRNKLVAWKEEIGRQNRETLQVLHEDSAQHAHLADRPTSETDRALVLRARDRHRKLIAKI